MERIRDDSEGDCGFFARIVDSDENAFFLLRERTDPRATGFCSFNDNRMFEAELDACQRRTKSLEKGALGVDEAERIVIR